MLQTLYRSLVVTTALLGVTTSASAADEDARTWPQKQVRVIVPYSPGGSADTLGRAISHYLGGVFKQSFVVENRAGAGGIVGSQGVARAAPDGYTLVVSGIGSHVIAPLHNASAFDPLKDFTHIAMLGGPPTALVVPVDSPVKTLDDFIQYAKSRPEGISWGSPGQGTHGALIGEAFRQAANLDMTHIGYKGAATAVVDLMANHLQAAFITLSSATAGLQSGKLRAIALTSAERLSDYSEVPTFKELGYPQLTGTTWFSLSGPAGMSPELVTRLNREVRAGLETSELQNELRKQNMETMDLDAEEFTNYMKTQIAHWGTYIESPKPAKP